MLEAAREAAESVPSPPLLLAVTALTSLSLDDARSIGVQDELAGWAERLAGLAREARIPGLVASAHELPHLRRKFGDTIVFVIPGIRPGGAPTQDQARTATPAEAISGGAGYLVVGRPILQDPDPACAADRIVEEIAAQLPKSQKL